MKAIRADYMYGLVGGDKLSYDERSELMSVSMEKFRKSMVSELCSDDDFNVWPTGVENEGD